MLFGAFTVLPYWGMLRRVFEPRVAFWSALLLALFGFHIAYSVTTSSEGPTIFFFVLGFYVWVRFRLGDGWVWLLPCGLGFIAASPSCVETNGELRPGRLRDSTAWKPNPGKSAGVIGWMLYSFWAWGDPLAAAKRNAWTAQYLQPQHSLVHRLLAVPGALVVTLSPLVVGLATWGLVQTRVRTESLKRALAVVALFMVSLQVLNSVTSNLTMARFTLMYSWLLIPYAFEVVRALPVARGRKSCCICRCSALFSAVAGTNHSWCLLWSSRNS